MSSILVFICPLGCHASNQKTGIFLSREALMAHLTNKHTKEDTVQFIAACDEDTRMMSKAELQKLGVMGKDDKKKGKYAVFFEQINQVCIEVSAKDKEEAIKKATKKYVEEGWTEPTVSGVERC